MFSLILKEIRFRPLNALFSLLAMLLAVSLFVAFFTMSKALRTETIRLTRDMGFNLRIIPGNTNMNDFWVTGYSDTVMSENNLQQLMKFKDISYAHLTATLHHKTQWRGREVILTGIAPEYEPSGKKKAPMLFQVRPGTVFIGYQLGLEFDLHEGDTIRLYNRKFRIQRVLAETGSVDDIRIYLQLEELQKLLDMEGKINEIRAINCLCLSEGQDPLNELRQQLEETLPGSKVIMNRTIANARQEQRHTIDKYFGVILPFVLITSFLWVAAMAYVNVNDRKTEIGIYRALGFTSGKIGWIFIGKALMLGLVAAVAGFSLGTWLTFSLGPHIFKVTAHVITTDYRLLKWALILTPAGALLASMVPALLAVFQDPAETLRHA